MDNGHLNIDRVAFLGRTFAEYMDMFGLDRDILSHGRILDCPAGPSSFAAEAGRAGFEVTACDIQYGLSADALLEKGKEDIRHVFEKFDEVSHLYTWEYYKNKDEVVTRRNMALGLFSEDYSRHAGQRYVYARLPKLPFPDKAFSLVLSGHFLFLYGDRLDPDFHKACVKELVRVCSSETRIFPFTGLDAKPYPYLEDVLASISAEGAETEICEVPLKFQLGGGRMIKISRGLQGGV